MFASWTVPDRLNNGFLKKGVEPEPRGWQAPFFRTPFNVNRTASPGETGSDPKGISGVSQKRCRRLRRRRQGHIFFETQGSLLLALGDCMHVKLLFRALVYAESGRRPPQRRHVLSVHPRAADDLAERHVRRGRSARE